MVKTRDSLLLMFNWNSPRGPIDPVELGSPTEVMERLNAAGIKWLVLGLPFGAYRLPVLEDGEFLADFYLDLERLSAGDANQAEGFLNDGGLQIRVGRNDDTATVDLLIVPALDQRFATKCTITMPMTALMNAWRTIAMQLMTLAAAD